MITQSVVQPEINTTFKGNVNIEKLFELAVETANKGYKLKAMEIAREALIFAKQSNDYLAVYIHGFLSVLSLDFKKVGNARIHIYNAMNRLNKQHFSYETDQQYLSALLNKINQIDNTPSMVSEPLAA